MIDCCLDLVIIIIAALLLPFRRRTSLRACPAACFAAWDVLLRSILDEIFLNWYFNFFSASVVFFVCCL